MKNVYSLCFKCLVLCCLLFLYLTPFQNVKAATVPVTGISFTEYDRFMYNEIGSNNFMSIEIYPSNATNKSVIWSSSDPTVGTVGSDGVFVAKKRGTTTIYAKTVDGGFVDHCVIQVVGTWNQKMLLMSKASYRNDLKSYKDYVYGYDELDEWILYEKYSDPLTSLQVAVYRTKYIDEWSLKYDYVFAFRGTQDKLDIIAQDPLQVILNEDGLQITVAENYVKNFLNRERYTTGFVAFTGHSLGGYLANWMATEVVDGNISVPDSGGSTTFNAVGLSPFINFNWNDYLQNAHTMKVYEKITNDLNGKYTYSCVNLRINNDPVSAIFSPIGTVRTYDAAGFSVFPWYYHELDRFSEINFE